MEENRKILTISIAAYNVEKYINKCLESLFKDKDIVNYLDIIVEDDGSTDCTSVIAKEYEKLYPLSVRVINKRNGGYGSTINNSINLAKGKYFKQLDGDDWFDENNLGMFVRWLKSIDTDFVFTPYYNCYEEGVSDLIDNCKNVTCDYECISSLNSCGNFAMHELTIKTKLLKDNNIEISENCFYTDNEYTFLPLMFAKNVSKFNKPIYCYRLGRDGQSVSIAGVQKHYEDSIIVAKKMYEAYKINYKNISTIANIAELKIRYITDTVYTYCLISTPKYKAKSKLIQFDSYLKTNYIDIYNDTNNIKKIKFLRLTNFMFFEFTRKWIIRKWD